MKENTPFFYAWRFCILPERSLALLLSHSRSLSFALGWMLAHERAYNCARVYMHCEIVPPFYSFSAFAHIRNFNHFHLVHSINYIYWRSHLPAAFEMLHIVHHLVLCKCYAVAQCRQHGYVDRRHPVWFGIHQKFSTHPFFDEPTERMPEWARTKFEKQLLHLFGLIRFDSIKFPCHR